VTLTFEWLELPTAALGEPDAVSMLQAPKEFEVHTEDVPDALMADGLRRGRPATLLPFTSQSGYDRRLTPVRHPVAVLRGERLEATFLLDLGGRLWSLKDLASGRELLYSNAAIQFANLGIRDAWFAGGVEWNVGLIGHTPLTCSPVHAGSVDSPVGPVLRLWEFDRLRDCVYRVDAWLDDDTGLLCVRPEIHNPNAQPVDTYWWSNTAVPLSQSTRIVVPADTAWKFGFERVMRRVPVGGAGDDSVWPWRGVGSADYFFDLGRGATRPWIAAVEGDGTGIVQTSSARLQGRKLFVWGEAQGGQRWQRWLSPLGGRYAEIQAGLARTQMEHLPLGGGDSLHWVETYGPLQVDAQTAVADWPDAVAGVARAIQAEQPDSWLAGVELAADTMAALPPIVRHSGSGWGALERVRRESAGDRSLTSTATPFNDDTLGPEQAAWLALLRDGAFPAADPCEPPGSYQRSSDWADRLQADGGWRAQLHLGEIRWHQGDADGARQAWEASVAEAPNPWAWRDLGLAAQAGGDLAGAAGAYTQACDLRLDVTIVLERLEVLLAGQPGEALTVIDELPPWLRADPRVRVAAARAACDAGLIERALQELTPLPHLATLREGETLLDVLWQRVQDELATAASTPLTAQWLARGSQLPADWDFRMAPEQTEASR